MISLLQRILNVRVLTVIILYSNNIVIKEQSITTRCFIFCIKKANIIHHISFFVVYLSSYLMYIFSFYVHNFKAQTASANKHLHLCQDDCFL